DLCQRQSAADGAMVRCGAHRRPHRRADSRLARSHPPGDRRCGARGGAALARQAPLGHRLSDQGNAGRGETLVKATLSTFIRGAAAGALVVLVGLVVVAPAARAMTIERVKSPGGIEAWLVHDRTLPLIAVEFAFRGSADQDPADKPGVANL